MSRAVELILERDKSLVNEWRLGQTRTPLHVAASHDHPECIRVLVLVVSRWSPPGHVTHVCIV